MIQNRKIFFFSDFCTKFSHSLPASHIENIDLSNNPLEDKGKKTDDRKSVSIKLSFKV